MATLPERVDCLVAGGGPAGAALAGLLARTGAQVLLVDAGNAVPAAPVETLLPASLQALARCGLAAVLEQHAVRDQRRHGAAWEQPEVLWQPPTRPGLCLHRPEFDAALRCWAVAQGAVVATPAVVVALPAAVGAPTRVRTLAGPMEVQAQEVVVATGRRRALAGHTADVAVTGSPAASFAFAAADSGGSECAVVKAGRDGWCWWIAAGTRGVLLATVDADALRRHGRRTLLTRLFVDVGEPFAALLSARPLGAVRSTPRLSTARGPWFLLGDAAATLDPLASQGTEKALVGAEAAALAVRTALADPQLATMAREHHAAWERELFFAHLRTTAEFYARVERFGREPFWQRRAAAAAPLANAALPRRLVVGGDVQLEPVLQRRGEQLVVVQGCRRGSQALAAVGRVAVEPLLLAFARPCDVAAGVATAGQDVRLFALGSAAVRMAVIELWQRGVLVVAD